MRALLIIVASVALSLAADLAIAAPAGRRVALVIGNSKYVRFPALTNPRNDARDVTDALGGAGFEVFGGVDLSREAIREQLRLFARAAQGADAALAYYAGHGLQYKGRNYIVPTDAKLQDEFDLEYETVRIDDVVGELGRAEGAHILILDACRDLPVKENSTRNPFTDTGLAKISGRGLVVAYATQANALAYDGTGRNSIFTGAFLQTLREPGLDLPQFFQRVSVSVDRASHGRQTPELSLSYPGQFIFNSGETDRDAWRKVRESSDPAVLRSFLEKYPTSDFLDAANTKLALIEEMRRSGQREAELRAAQQAESERRRQEADARLLALADEERRRVEATRLAEEAQRRRVAEERHRADLLRVAEMAREAEQARLGEEQRKAEDARKAADLRQARLVEERQRAEAARLSEEARKAESLRLAEEGRKAEAARVARLADERQKAEALRLAEETRKVEAARLAHLVEERQKAEALAAAEETRKVEAVRVARLVEERQRAEALASAEEARKVEAARLARLVEERQRAEAFAAAEEARRSEIAQQARLADERRTAEAARLAEDARLAAEARRNEVVRLAALREPERPAGRTAGDGAFAATGGAGAAEPQRSEEKSGAPVVALLSPSDAANVIKPVGLPIQVPNPTYANLGGGTANPSRDVRLEGEALVRTIHERLSVVGCYTKRPEASWDQDSVEALKRFYHFAQSEERASMGAQRSLKVAATQPDLGVLDDLNRYDRQICPIVCPEGAREHGGVCVTVSCPAGFELRGSICTPLPAVGRRNEPGVRVREPEAPRQAEKPMPRVRNAAPEPRRAAPAPEARRPAREAKAPAPPVRERKPVVRVVEPVRLHPRVAPLAHSAPAQPARPTASASPDFGPAHIGAVRAMTRMP